MRYFSPRYLALIICLILVVSALLWHGLHPSLYWVGLIAGALSLLGIRDLVQTKHAVQRNYPILAHFRFLIEKIRPELRQYLFESDTEATPFSRNQRAIVYQRAKQELDKRPFWHSTQCVCHRLRVD